MVYKILSEIIGTQGSIWDDAKRGSLQVCEEKGHCGIVAVQSLKGPSKAVVRKTLDAGKMIEHRGGNGPDGSGDGAGIAFSLLTDVYSEEFQVNVPQLLPFLNGNYATGLLYLPPGEAPDGVSIQRLLSLAEDIGLEPFVNDTSAFFRKVPYNASVLSEGARKSHGEHVIQPFFKPSEGQDDSDFYLNLSRLFHQFNNDAEASGAVLASLTNAFLTYQGLCKGTELPKIYPGLDESEVAIALQHRREATNTEPGLRRLMPIVRQTKQGAFILVHNGEFNTLRALLRLLLVLSPEISDRLGYDVTSTKDLSDTGVMTYILEALLNTGWSFEEALQMLFHQNSKNPDAFQRLSILFGCAAEGPAYVNIVTSTKTFVILDPLGIRPGNMGLQTIETDDHGEIPVFISGSTLAAFQETADPDKTTFEVVTEKDTYVAETSESDIESDNEEWHYAANAMKSQDRLFKETDAASVDAYPKHPHYAPIKTSVSKILVFDQATGKTAPVAFDDAFLEKCEKAMSNVVTMDSSNVRLQAKMDLAKLTSELKANGFGQDHIAQSHRIIKSGKVAKSTAAMGDQRLRDPKDIYGLLGQSFAQVTNPPTNAHDNATNGRGRIGPAPSLLAMKDMIEKEEVFPASVDADVHCGVLSSADIEWLRSDASPLKSKTLSLAYNPNETGTLEKALEKLRNEALVAVRTNKFSLLILSDENCPAGQIGIPTMLAAAVVKNVLITNGCFNKAGVVSFTSDLRDEVDLAMTMTATGLDGACPRLKEQVWIHDAEQKIEQKASTKSVREQVDGHYTTLRKLLMAIPQKMGVSMFSAYKGAKLVAPRKMGPELCTILDLPYNLYSGDPKFDLEYLRKEQAKLLNSKG